MTHPKTGEQELLRSIAESASSGPWHIRTGKNGELDLFILDMKCKYIARMWVTGSHVKQDAEFISAFSPSVVLKMMNDLKAHQSQTELLRKEVDEWEACAKGWMNSTEKAQKRVEKLRGALKFYKKPSTPYNYVAVDALAADDKASEGGVE
jgi:hypothetical protein